MLKIEIFGTMKAHNEGDLTFLGWSGEIPEKVTFELRTAKS